MPKAREMWIHLNREGGFEGFKRKLEHLPLIGEYIQVNDYKHGHLSQRWYRVTGYSVNQNDLCPIINAESTPQPRIAIEIEERGVWPVPPAPPKPKADKNDIKARQREIDAVAPPKKKSYRGPF